MSNSTKTRVDYYEREKKKKKIHLIWSSFWFSLNVQDSPLNVLSCILKNLKDI